MTVSGVVDATGGLPVFPMPRATGCPFDPPPDLLRLQAESPVVRVRSWNGKPAWLVLGQEHVRSILTDPRVSSDVRLEAYPHAGPGLEATKDFSPTILTLDNPEHDVRRRMLAHFFMPKRVELLRPQVQTLVDELVDSMQAANGTVELVIDFALPIPSTIIGVVLGIPYDDHEFFQSRSRAFLENTMDDQERQVFIAEFTDYLGRLLDSKRENPGEDVASYLAGRVADGTLTRAQALHDVQLLLVAGHHSTANMIALGALVIMRHPEIVAELVGADDPKLTSAAVEELLRYLTILHSGRRRAVLEDLTLNGEQIKAGDGLIIANNVANRDPAAYEHPDDVDIHRPDLSHGAFGFGIHQCLGQHLARVELQVAYTTLFRRLPGLRPAVPFEDLTYREEDVVYGVWELPVTWDGRGAV
jgi:cytochrome P450